MLLKNSSATKHLRGSRVAWRGEIIYNQQLLMIWDTMIGRMALDRRETDTILNLKECVWLDSRIDEPYISSLADAPVIISTNSPVMTAWR